LNYRLIHNENAVWSIQYKGTFGLRWKFVPYTAHYLRYHVYLFKMPSSGKEIVAFLNRDDANAFMEHLAMWGMSPKF